VSDVIEIRGLSVLAIVGVLAEERERAQPVELDLDIARPLEAAALNDDVTVTTNYAQVATVAANLVREGRFLLLETLVYQVGHAVLNLDREITSVMVAARKTRPPVDEHVESVGVRITLHRS
jgi:7,8-dihydroneopterin aldolase/epimerase/oxygenase